MNPVFPPSCLRLSCSSNRKAQGHTKHSVSEAANARMARVSELFTVNTAKMKQMNCNIGEVDLVWHDSLSECLKQRHVG